MPDWYEELKALFRNQIGKGEMAGTAYDTAWVASIPDPEHPDRPAFPEALEWLRLHQLPDGSWGASDLLYVHDRIISTLISILTLAKWESDDWSKMQIDAGLRAIWRTLASLFRDPYETIGFELVLPTLLELAQKSAFKLPYSQFEGYAKKREHKLSLLPPSLIYSRCVSSAFSLEFLGDGFDVAAALAHGDLKEVNGSIASSPSASAYYFTKMQDNEVFGYLRTIHKSGRGSIPPIAPFEVFERAWTLYNLEKAGYDLASSEPAVASHVEALYKTWTPHGVSHTKYFSVPELDDTAMTFRVLRLAGFDISLDVFAEYELENHFRCFPYERDTSISAHIHLLEALNAAGCKADNSLMQKALRFIITNRTRQTYWFDKWHTSPYYATAHCVIDLEEMDGNHEVCDVIDQAVQWIEQTQSVDGSWGFYGRGTAEETAYCLQALLHCRATGRRIDDPRTILSAANFLIKSKERKYCSYTPLWIGKSLYVPTYVVHSAVLSALSLAQEANLPSYLNLPS